jgi:integrase
LSWPGCALDVPKQQSTTVTNSGHSPGPSTPDLQRQQGWDRTADLTVFSRVGLVRVRPGSSISVASAQLSEHAGRLLIPGDLPRNPAAIKGAGIERAAEMRHISIPQLTALAEAVPARYRALILVAGFGGLRWAELVGLRRRHVNLAGARLEVVEQAAEVAGTFIVSPPKTDAGRRVVTLPTLAVTALAEHLDRYAGPGPDGLVFLSARGKHLARSSFRRLVWLPAVRQVGLDGLRVHDLRHTAATLAAATGATTKELMERMGHASSAVALRYQHVMADRQAALAAALDDLARDATSAAPRETVGHVEGTTDDPAAGENGRIPR